MTVIWVSCHMRANAVKSLDLEIGAVTYGCCVRCESYVNDGGRRSFATMTADERSPGGRRSVIIGRGRSLPGDAFSSTSMSLWL